MRTVKFGNSVTGRSAIRKTNAAVVPSRRPIVVAAMGPALTGSLWVFGYVATIIYGSP